jgi:hypothetical protein
VVFFCLKARLEKYYVYLDESGDLGWKLDLPYLRGGSSRFLTISSILIHEADKHRLKRIMKTFREKLSVNPGEEVKATDLTAEKRILFCDIFNKEAIKASKLIRVCSKTVNKANVDKQIFKDHPNTLYNYTTSLGLLDKIKDFDHVELFADARITKIEAKYSFNEYLQTKLAGDLNSKTILNIHQQNSKDSDGVQCADIIANIIWRSYEFEIQWEKPKIASFVHDNTLFF